MTPKNNQSQRREFLKNTAVVTATSSLLMNASNLSAGLFNSQDETIKIGLVGCGGRGTGACIQALSTYGNVELVAMGDTDKGAVDGALERIKKAVAKKEGAKISVDEEHKFVGFDSYNKVIGSGIDLVILATPPGFRPQQFEAAVNAGKHIFMEKPVATDVYGVKRVLAAAEEAKKKNLKVGVGLQRHHQNNYLDLVQKIHDGVIGDIETLRVYWCNQGIWEPRKKREDCKTEMEYQMYGWYYFTWICGDQICEQHIHNIDVGCWMKGFKYPVSARGMGGREVRRADKYGDIFDHHAVEYTFEDGSKMFAHGRHMQGCWNEVAEFASGTKGRATGSDYQLFGKDGEKYSYRGPKNDPYQTEHDDLFKAIRENTPYTEAHNGAMSTMTAILGRMSTWSGKEVTMEKALESNFRWVPDSFSWEMTPPIAPDANGKYPVAVPGVFDPYKSYI
jgi:predicted dehydrogenase